MDLLKFLTSIYHKGLSCGVFSVDEVILFCDRVIEISENPPIEIIEASLMRSKKIDDLETKLDEYHSSPYDELNVGIILSVINHKLSNKEIDFLGAVQCSSRILMHSGFCYESEYYTLYNIEDIYGLAEEQIYGDLEEIEVEFEKEISKYDEYYNVFKEYQNKAFSNKFVLNRSFM